MSQHPFAGEVIGYQLFYVKSFPQSENALSYTTVIVVAAVAMV